MYKQKNFDVRDALKFGEYASRGICIPKSPPEQSDYFTALYEKCMQRCLFAKSTPAAHWLIRALHLDGRPVHFAGIHDSVKLPEVRNKWLAVQTEHSEHSAILTIVSICWHTHGNATGTEHPFVCDSF